MSRFWKQGVALSVLAVAAGLWCLSASQAAKPGGGGSNTLTNPAFVYYDGAGGGLFLMNSSGATKVRLTTSGGVEDLGPTWSPDLNPGAPGTRDGSRSFVSTIPAYIWGDIMAVPSDGSGPATVLRSYVDFSVPPPQVENGEACLSWSPDGSRIIYASEGAIWALTRGDRPGGQDIRNRMSSDLHRLLPSRSRPISPSMRAIRARWPLRSTAMGPRGATGRISAWWESTSTRAAT